ncbi:hypothetical protein DOY81_000047 [Sarcophaga bullata]|nr:hypothetical protein DOY81_000047 [Sarcophaga bullata]
MIMKVFSKRCVILASVVRAAPLAVNNNATFVTLNHAIWPPMQHHDIWNDGSRYFEESEQDSEDFDNKDENDILKQQQYSESMNDSTQDIYDNFVDSDIENDTLPSKRQGKVIHLFPVPVDGECLSDDGRRTGSCLNAYECRNKGGEPKGECALGFVIANCNETVNTNITYLVSPNFPSFMTNNVTNCSLKIKLMNDDVSQLRIDFYHFILGQPNRRNGICDGDVFRVSGGPGGVITLCGQNSGQHIYYDVGGRMLPRQTLYGSLKPLRYEDLYPPRNDTNDTTMEIDLMLNFAPRFLPTRLWEIRIAQIPFSQRAPAGCLQYFTGTEGIFQTFNFADNGRHLANQNYRICMRQEMDMCSIVYQPCDEQSFRIGPSSLSGSSSNSNGQFTTNSGVSQENYGNGTPQVDNQQMQILADDSGNIQTILPNMTTSSVPAVVSSLTPEPVGVTTTPITSSVTTTLVSTVAALAGDTGDNSTSAASAEVTSSSVTTPASITSTPLSDDAEGSGGGNENDVNTRFRPTTAVSNVSRRPRPTRGGFDLLGFLRSAFDFGFRSSRQMRLLSQRQRRQFYSNCGDRITMPCIIEDFIGTGLGPLPGCEPVHCGMQFCSNGIWPCRIESTVTPFYVGIHFGDGSGKGSPEDNIGACLRYQQVQYRNNRIYEYMHTFTNLRTV